MSFFNFNKKAKHRRFDFIPRYYDADKEDLQNRLRIYDSENLDQTELAKNRIRSGLRTKYRIDEGYKSEQKSKSNRTLLYVFVTLALITWLILRSEGFTNLVSKFLDV